MEEPVFAAPHPFAGFDQTVLSLFNGMAGRVPIADELVAGIANNPLVKGIFAAMLLWAAWFSRRVDDDGRKRLMGVAVVGAISIGVGRFLANTLPFRPRPMHEVGISFNKPFGMPTDVLSDWSSMPSDHAVMYFSLATGIFLVHRLLGVIALLHAAMIISLPRIYLGFHYPTDIIAGAMIGIALTVLLLPATVRVMDRIGLTRWPDVHPASFYAVMFFVTFQIATMFGILREAARDIAALLG